MQSRTAGAFSFRLIAWSSSRLGGNLSASFSSNTLACQRYSSGICLAVAIVVTTLQGRLVTRTVEALERSSGMTLSRADLVLYWFLCEKCPAT